MKTLAVVAAALLINVGLFQLMERMVSRDSVRLVDVYDTEPIEFLRSNFDEETQVKDRRTPPPPKPQEIERPRAEVEDIAQRASAFPTDFSPFEITSLLGEGGGVGIGSSIAAETTSGMGLMMAEDLVPLSLLPPQYPSNARIRNIEGWVDMVFTVTEDGTVRDPEIMDAEPSGIFDEAARDAALRWRFRPQVDNGETVAVRAFIRINFTLEQ